MELWFNVEFEFMCDNLENCKFKVNHGSNISALYDTYIYLENKLIFLSCSKESFSSYIVHIYIDKQTIHFRPVDSPGNSYKIKLCSDTGELIFDLI